MGPPLPVPGLCPPPLRAPHSPGRRRKSTLRRPPRALPAREAPGPLPGEASRLRSRRVSSRHLAPRAPVRPVYARRHGNAAARLGDRPNRWGRGLRGRRGLGLRRERPSRLPPAARSRPHETAGFHRLGRGGSEVTEVAQGFTARKEQGGDLIQKSFSLPLAALLSARSGSSRRPSPEADADAMRLVQPAEP
ncbi:uncharacterized protein LOC144576934 isoform X2 [Callithrix jacchus]